MNRNCFSKEFRKHIETRKRKAEENKDRDPSPIYIAYSKFKNRKGKNFKITKS